MDYKIKHLPKSLVEIIVTIADDQMPAYLKKATEEIARDIDIKGFRKGHVPPHILEQHVDKKYITAHAQDLAIRESYAEIVTKEKLQIVTRPEVKLEKENPLTYMATVAVMPHVEIKDHKSIKSKKEEVKVTEKDLEEVINDLKKYNTIYKDVEREIKKGDRAEIDFEGFDEQNGAAVPNTKSTNHPLIVGDSTLIPGFEENLIGLKKDDKKEFDLTFPKDYHKKDFQNKKLKFKVEVKRIEEPSTPELNEALIERATGHKHTVDEFKKELEENIRRKKEDEAKVKQENEYIEKVLKEMKVELPQIMIDDEAQFMISEIKEEIEAKGMEFKKFLEQAKTTEEDLLKKYSVEAEKRVKIRLALQFLLKAEEIKISDEDLKTELDKLKAMYPEDQHKKIEAEFAGGKLSTQIANRLAIQKLFDKVLQA
ncbi:trigger factor [Candidatus Peregrinibacteria bacterium]|nr:trigger factor [Candidatus Peregrinibacteria bacterium]